MGSVKPKKRNFVCEITDEDIKRGIRCNSRRCAGARAFRRATGLRGFQFGVPVNNEDAGRTETGVVLNDGSVVLLPKKVQRFVVRFDMHNDAEPMKFRVKLPEAS